MPTLTHQTGPPEPEQSGTRETGGGDWSAGESTARTRPPVPDAARREASRTDSGERFPDLDIRQPAPAVDATRREEVTRAPRDAQRPERESHQSRDVEPRAERAVEDVFSQGGSDLMAYDSEVDRVVDRLYREVERKMQIERERRGL